MSASTPGHADVTPDPGAGPAGHADVLIVGAGLSGIGTACRLQAGAPGISYAIVEARGASGGTWDLFRFPGVRSDSDMFTLGYPFRPWTGAEAIAGGGDILRYLRDTAAAYGVDKRISYHCRVIRADWSGQQARWTVTVEDAGTGRARRGRAASCTCAPATTGTTRATRRTGRAWRTSPGRWRIPSTGPKT